MIRKIATASETRNNVRRQPLGVGKQQISVWYKREGSQWLVLELFVFPYVEPF